MNMPTDRYYKLMRCFLDTLGLWPYRSIIKRRIIHFIFYIVNISVAVPQIIMMVQHKNKTHIIIKNSIVLMYFGGCFVKYSIAYINGTQFKLLLNQISNDWQRIKEKSEFEILKKHYEEGGFFIMLYIAYISIGALIFMFFPFYPLIFDLISPLSNGSRPLIAPFYANYVFIDQVQYHYAISLHFNVVYLSSVILLIGVDSAFILTIKHTSGLFAITCQRIVSATESKNNDNIGENVCVNLKQAVVLHNETMECTHFIEDAFTAGYVIVQCICICGFGLVFVFLFYINQDTLIAVRCMTLFFGTMTHICYINWLGQEIINSSEDVMKTAYLCNWYTLPLNTRKLIQIIMARSLKPCILKAEKLSNLSLETFMKILRSSLSYYTIFLSMSQK